MKQTIKSYIWRAVVLLTAVALCFCVVPGLNAKAEQTEKRTIRIPCGINDLLRLDENGKPIGYCVDYLNELALINNWTYEYVNCTWSDAITMLESGEIDILFPTNYMPERENTMDFSTLVGGYTSSGLFARSDTSYGYDDFSAYNGARIAVTPGSSNEQALVDFAETHGFTYTPVYLNSMDEKIQALEAGQIDMILVSASNDIPDTVLLSVLDASPFYFTVKKGNTELLNELNRGMQLLITTEPELVAETAQKCLVGDNTNALALTDEERAFAASNPEIVVGFYEETEPLAYIQEDGTYSGIYVKLLEHLRDTAGLNLTLCPINRSQNWKKLLKSGEIDFYIGASENIVRQDDEIYSTNAILDYENILITQRSCAFDSLDVPVIALTQGRSYWTEYLPELLQKDIEIQYYTSARQCLLAVTHGDADATLINNLEFNYQSKNDRFANLIQWQNFHFPSEVGLATTMDTDSPMFSIVNKAIRQLSPEFTNSIINNYLNMPYDSYTLADQLYASRMVLITVSISILAIVIILVVIWLAHRRQRTAEETIQKREKYQLQILAALSQDYSVIYYVDLDRNQSKAVQQEKGLRDTPDEDVPLVRQYSEAMQSFLDTYVQPDTKGPLLELCDPQAVICRFREEKGFTVRYRILPNHRNQEFFEMHFVDVSESGQEHAMVLGIRCVDEAVHEEQTQKQLLQDALEAANRASAAKSDFMSKMSHDIRTPMNAIIGMTAIAATHAENSDRVRDALSKISSSSRHLLGLINEVLDMSKIESSTISLTAEEFSLSDLLNSMLLMIQPQIQAHKHRLQIHIQDIQHENVIGDSLRIQQVFLNLMSNAVKYTPDGGEISFTVREQAVSTSSTGCYEFIIEDNGIGMSEEYLTHIFEPFSRAEDLRTSKIQGTGLGMAITQNIVHMMNGNITVESQLGKGSKFTVTIYLRLQDAQDIDTSELADLSVLVVDDDDCACQSLCTMLDEIGMRSEGCTSGQDAVAAVQRALNTALPFYAAILDWKMPGMDGLDTARAIKRLVGDTLPIIILSAYDWSDIELEARAAGVDAFLSKPVFKSGLIRTFKSLRNEAPEDSGQTSPLEPLLQNDFSGHRVLLVEDNDLNREIAREVLELVGLTVEEAENGKIAVEMFSAAKAGYYSLILMDIQMPVMNGYDAATAIRAMKHPDALRVPILAMTANAFVEDIQAAKAAGMNEHLAKPINFEMLSSILKKYL
ncbi:MAG: transporter substrate-binding domain-containing protein [Coprococcus sp.]|nr:transporter substrate-binding domain-containing protein [Lachnospiraceae bacterium]MBP3325687.1 transporter substrate-binding domain-containing protein [Coprococcus sp.]